MLAKAEEGGKQRFSQKLTRGEGSLQAPILFVCIRLSGTKSRRGQILHLIVFQNHLIQMSPPVSLPRINVFQACINNWMN